MASILTLFSRIFIPLLFKYSTFYSLCQLFGQSASNCPSRKGGVLLRSAFARGATKGVGERSAISLFFLWEFSGQKKCILGSEISHFRATIWLLCVCLLEKNFRVVSNTSRRRFLDSTEQSPNNRTSAISFSIQDGISFSNFTFHF